MAFPTIQDAAGYKDSSNTSFSITMPSGITAGDLLLVIVVTNSAVINSHPSGWTRLRDSTQSPVYAKVAAGGDSATVGTSSTTALSAISLRIDGWQGSINDGTNYISALDTSINPNPPSNTPTWGTEDTLWIAAYVCLNETSSPIDDVPTNYTYLGVGANFPTVRGGYRENATSSEDPGTFTLTDSDTWRAHTIAVRAGQFEQNIIAPLVSVSPTFYGPTFSVGSVSLTAPLVDVSPTIYGPGFAIEGILIAPLVDVTPTIYAPTFADFFTLEAPLVNLSPTIYAPSIKPQWIDVDDTPASTWTDTDPITVLYGGDG